MAPVEWTAEKVAALAEGRRRAAAELAEAEALAARRAACRELVGCACVGARHRVGCSLRKAPGGARGRAGGGWTPEARAAAAARARARWAALEPSERTARARRAGKARRGRWTPARRAAQSARMRERWRKWRSGEIAVSAAQVRVLHSLGMWR